MPLLDVLDQPSPSPRLDEEQAHQEEQNVERRDAERAVGRHGADLSSRGQLGGTGTSSERPHLVAPDLLLVVPLEDSLHEVCEGRQGLKCRRTAP